MVLTTELKAFLESYRDSMMTPSYRDAQLQSGTPSYRDAQLKRRRIL